MERKRLDLYQTGTGERRGQDTEMPQPQTPYKQARLPKTYSKWWILGYAAFLLLVGFLTFYLGKRQRQGGAEENPFAPAVGVVPGGGGAAVALPAGAGPDVSEAAVGGSVQDGGLTGTGVSSGVVEAAGSPGPEGVGAAQGDGEETRVTVDRMTIDRARQMVGESKRLQQEGNLAAAMEMVDNALALLPDMLAALQQKAAISTEAGEYDKARTTLLRALALAPSQPLIYNNLGYVQAQLKRYDEAIASYRTAVQMQDDYVPALYNLSLLYSDRGRYLDALPLLESALKVEPSNVSVLSQLSLTLIRTSETRLALQFLDKARSLETDNGKLLMLTAMAYAARGDYGAAATWIERATGLVHDGVVSPMVVRNYMDQPEIKLMGERDPDLMGRLEKGLVAAETVSTGGD